MAARKKKGAARLAQIAEEFAAGVDQLAELAAEFKAEGDKLQGEHPDCSGEMDLAAKRFAEARMWLQSAQSKLAGEEA